LRDPQAVRDLFDERVSEFLNRPGGYTRIYKLVPRVSDATPVALIELIPPATRKPCLTSSCPCPPVAAGGLFIALVAAE